MMDFIMVPTVIGLICVTVYKLFELFARRRERLIMIEKLEEIKGIGQVEGQIDLSFGKSYSYWALRGGCLLIGIGLGLLLGFLMCKLAIPEYPVGKFSNSIVSIIYGGAVLLMGGLGLIIAFILELKYNKKDK